MNNCTNCSNNNTCNNNVRSSYHQKALQQIRNSLQPFATYNEAGSYYYGGATSASSSPCNGDSPPPGSSSYWNERDRVESGSTTSSSEYYYKNSSSGTLTPTTNSCSSRQSPSSNLLSSQLPPPAVSRPGGIEYRAQQYPFVPSQVPLTVQQLLRRIDLNNPPPPPPNSATITTASKKPTLIIKSTVVPKPVLQTATNVDKPSNSQQQQPPPPPYQQPVVTPPPPLPPKPKKNDVIHTHESPIPERKKLSKEKEEERFESKVRVYSPAAFKFFMEQHVENVIKSHQERLHRRLQLESEMAKIGLSEEAQTQMRRMLSQKESNYIRLKRAKMEKSMFKVIRTIGVGAFGEVALVRKIDTQLLYAMKTLRKSDVLRRNQVAHVKAERDILAEADNEWVVKLYYSFQDKDHLYFVMDYIPGGDLMSLLIKKGIFDESLAQFYIGELTCAIESVHRMGFIHRDIKPDNILIDRDGHIKLTDFGLCTGFRWTHNSKYYQESNCTYCTENICNEHGNKNSGPKVLERRRMMMMKNGNKHDRSLAHSLVGTPNYIAPEVLLRTGYTQLCDWWSVGVILYEMLVGQPPFLANTPAETQFKVINWEKTLRVPSGAGVSREARDLILKLCTDHSRRLGKNGAQEIKTHVFLTRVFASVLSEDSISSTSSSSCYSGLYSSSSSSVSSYEGPSCSSHVNIRRTIAPFIPKISHPTDTSNFDPLEEDSPTHASESVPIDYSYDNQFHGFFEFTFRRFFDDAYHLEDHSNADKINDKDKQTAKKTDNNTPVYV